MMLSQWQQKRFLVYHLVTYSIVATGATSYTFGPGGQLNTNSKAAWSLTALAPISGSEGSDYYVGEIVTLAGVQASSTPSNGPQLAQVTEVDSGAVTTVQVAGISSVGSIQFFSNPVDLDTITLDGTVWTFVAGTAGTAQTQILATADLTLAQLAVDLNDSEDETISQATYSVTGTLGATTLRLRLMFDATGEEGDEFTLAASVATPSGATLTEGADNETLYPGPLPATWTQASTAGSGWGLVLGFAEWALSAINVAVTAGSQAPAKIESAFLRQISASQPNPVDFYLDILQSMEDYNRIAIKGLESFPGYIFLDSQWPLATLFPWPVPQADLYSVNVTVLEQLQASFATISTPINMPFQYYSAMVLNLAVWLRTTFQIPTFSGDPLAGMAENSLNTLRGPNTQIARAMMPGALLQGGKRYNIFSDTNR